MSGEQCVSGGVGEVVVAAAGQHNHTLVPTLVFLVPAFDTQNQRQQVFKKILDYNTAEGFETGGEVTYVGEAGWGETGQVWSLTCHLMRVCRRLSLLPSQRCVLLSLHDQYQAIQLCLARINRAKRGEFMAAASDVLDVWNAMYRKTVAVDVPTDEETDILEELSHLGNSQQSCDPGKQELQEVMQDYQDFLTNSLCVDYFRVFECMRTLKTDNPALFREALSKVYIIESLEQLPKMERELLKLISEGSQVYRVNVELPFSETVQPSPSVLDISGIHETSALKTPSRHTQHETDSKDISTPQKPTQAHHTDGTTDIFKATDTPKISSSHDKQPTDQTDSTTDISKATDTPQTPSSHDKQPADQTDSTTDISKATDTLQVSSSHDKQPTDQTDSTTDISKATDTVQISSQNKQETETPKTPRHDKDQTDNMGCDTKDTEPQENASINMEKLVESITEVVDKAPHYLAKTTIRSESEAYVEKLFLAHLRLLVNTRDELALTLACSMPGREITHQGFTDIRQEAQRKEMPMYQTILSLILRQRLGGKGYQPDPNNPVLLHARPLGEFVDALLKLQNILEGQTDARQGATRVVSGIKTGLSKMKGCRLRHSTIQGVTDQLCQALQHLMDLPDDADANSASQANKNPCNLHPSLKHLIRLCDVAGGQVSSGGVVDALGDDILTQFSSTKKAPRTPVRLLSVLTLFRSPEGRTDETQEEMEEQDLETRLKGKMDQSAPAPTHPKRYRSECSWAPVDLSPIQTDTLNLSASPIAGPSLKVVGQADKRSSEASRESVASTTQDDNCVARPPSEGSASPAKPSTPKKQKDNDNKPKRARSKRSLLKDISNLDNKSDETQQKKQKVTTQSNKGPAKQKVTQSNKGPAKQRKDKSKPQLQGQRPITFFFRS